MFNMIVAYCRTTFPLFFRTLLDSVPLGLPLKDTMVIVRDDGGDEVHDGTGQIYLGGRYNVHPYCQMGIFVFMLPIQCSYEYNVYVSIICDPSVHITGR